jgi:superfamily I DNA/RNA helicase
LQEKGDGEAVTKRRHDDDLEQYQKLLTDLDHWVSGTHNKLKKELPRFTSVSDVIKEMDSSKVRSELSNLEVDKIKPMLLIQSFQELEEDLKERSCQLSDLVERCSAALERAAPEMEPLAAQLFAHLSDLQQSFNDAGAQLNSRLHTLQV